MPLMKTLNRDEPERIFISVLNNEGAAIVADQTVQLDVSTDVNGVRVKDMNTGELFCFLGVADQAIANGEYGLVQVSGYRSTSKVLVTNSDQATGLPLVPVAGADHFSFIVSSTTSSANVTLHPVFGFLAESIASATASATISAKIWIRGM